MNLIKMKIIMLKMKINLVQII